MFRNIGEQFGESVESVLKKKREATGKYFQKRKVLSLNLE